MGFKLVSDGEQLVRVALPYLATIYIVAMMLLRMGYSSTKGGGEPVVTVIASFSFRGVVVSVRNCLSSGRKFRHRSEVVYWAGKQSATEMSRSICSAW